MYVHTVSCEALPSLWVCSSRGQHVNVLMLLWGFRLSPSKVSWEQVCFQVVSPKAACRTSLLWRVKMLLVIRSRKSTILGSLDGLWVGCGGCSSGGMTLYSMLLCLLQHLRQVLFFYTRNSRKQQVIKEIHLYFVWLFTKSTSWGKTEQKHT